MSSRYKDYDDFAALYDQHWGPLCLRLLPALDRIVLNSMPPPADLLDLCCGTGQLARTLSERGYRVQGIDGSEEMLKLARRNAPACEFETGDARMFERPAEFDVAICTFDSLNHILKPAQLQRSFACVHQALRRGGTFVFDLNSEEGYLARWKGSFSIVQDEYAVIVRARYDPSSRIGEHRLTLFQKEGAWTRRDLEFAQRCYDNSEISALLAATGFTDITMHDSNRDLSMDEVGRVFFSCRKA